MSASTRTYCGQVLTPAYDECWWSTQIGGAHSWKYNAVYYSGSGSFVVCALITYYPRSGLGVSSCGQVDNTGLADALVTWCPSDRNVANKDVAVGNRDNNRHTLQGVASHDYPC